MDIGVNLKTLLLALALSAGLSADEVETSFTNVVRLREIGLPIPAGIGNLIHVSIKADGEKRVTLRLGSSDVKGVCTYTWDTSKRRTFCTFDVGSATPTEAVIRIND